MSAECTVKLCVMALALVLAVVPVGAQAPPQLEALGDGQRMMYQGMLGDRLCIDRGEGLDGAQMYSGTYEHTVHCMLIQECVDSGFSLMHRGTDFGYYAVYNFSAAETQRWVTFLQAHPMSRTNLVMSFTGTWNDGDLSVSQDTVELIGRDVGTRRNGQACDALAAVSCLQNTLQMLESQASCGGGVYENMRQCLTTHQSCLSGLFVAVDSTVAEQCRNNRLSLEATVCSDGVSGVERLCDLAATVIGREYVGRGSGAVGVGGVGCAVAAVVGLVFVLLV